MPTGFTIVSASHLQDATGTPVNNATISFLPVANNGVPLSFRSGGAEGQTISQSVTTQVTDGAFSLSLADTSLTTPINVGYRVTVTDNVSGKSLLGNGYGCIQPTNMTWDFDAFVPNLAAQVTVQAGPPGATGAAGVGSLPALALLRTKTSDGTGNLFNQATVSPGVIATADGTFSVNNNYSASDFIPANSGGQMTSSEPLFGFPGGLGIAYYDQNQAFISGDKTGYPAGTVLNIPANVAFIRFTLQNDATPDTRISRQMFCNGSVLPSTYQGFATYPSNVVDAKLTALSASTLSHGAYLNLQSKAPVLNNLYNYATSVTGFVQYDGATGANGGYTASDYIPANAGGTMVANFPIFGNGQNNGNGISYYDAQFDWLLHDGTGYAANTPINIPANAYFIRVTTDNNLVDITQMMLVNGSVLPSGYVSFGTYSKSEIDRKVAGFVSTTLGTGLELSDGIAADNAATVTQFQSYDLARSGRAGRYTMPHAGKTQHSFGDSLTYGLGSDAAHCFPQLLSTAIGTTLNNHGTSSDEASDLSLKLWSLAPWTPSQTIFTHTIGSTEALHQGAGAYEYVYLPTYLGNVAWMATGTSCCVDLTSVTAANWSHYTAFAGATGITAMAQGASISYPVTTYGAPLYVWVLAQDGDAGVLSVSVDGGAATTVNCFGAVPINTTNGATTGVQLARIPVAAGTHTVTLTVSTGGNVTVMAVGTPPAHVYYNRAVVLCGGIIPGSGDFFRAFAAQYNVDVIQCVKLLQGDGLDVRYVDNRAAMQDGLPSLYSGVGNPHPNSSGYALMAQPYITSAQLPPSPEVRRGAPVSGSKGTPGDTWAYGGYVYGVQADGTLQRTATASF